MKLYKLKPEMLKVFGYQYRETAEQAKWWVKELGFIMNGSKVFYEVCSCTHPTPLKSGKCEACEITLRTEEKEL